MSTLRLELKERESPCVAINVPSSVDLLLGVPKSHLPIVVDKVLPNVLLYETAFLVVYRPPPDRSSDRVIAEPDK